MLIAGPLVLLGLLWASFDWDRRFPWVLSASIGLPTTAAIGAGGQSLTPFVVMALAGVFVATLGWARGRGNPFGWPGATALVVFVLWSAFVTLAGPTVFDGIPVLASKGGIDQQVVSPSLLTYTPSNVFQTAYLVVNALLICSIATRRALSPHLLAPGLAIAMFVSNWRLSFDKLGVPYPAAQIDSGGFTYINSTKSGDYRLRGVFPEPSGLGICSVVAVVFAVTMILRTTGWTRAFYVTVAASAILNLSFANSGTGLVGSVAMGGLLAVALAYRAIVRGVSAVPFAVAACVAMIVFLIFSSQIVGYLVDAISDKTDTSSYASRSGADSFSYRLGVDTYGMGVGLGSNRPSSLWPMLFSCTGLIGIVAFATLIVLTVVRAARISAWAPTAWALIAVVVTKSVAGSTIADPVLIGALAAAAHAATQAHRPSLPPGLTARRRPARLARPAQA